MDFHDNCYKKPFPYFIIFNDNIATKLNIDSSFSSRACQIISCHHYTIEYFQHIILNMLAQLS